MVVMEMVLEEVVLELELEEAVELELEVVELTMVLKVAWFALREVRKTLTKTMEEFGWSKSRRAWEGTPWRC
jgi:hypothetical protein